jgi:hypothetical protein
LFLEGQQQYNDQYPSQRNNYNNRYSNYRGNRGGGGGGNNYRYNNNNNSQHEYYEENYGIGGQYQKRSQQTLANNGIESNDIATSEIINGDGSKDQQSSNGDI